jgi:hypothetical protein
MTDEIKDKITKVYALVNQGGTEGEKEAARKALDRLMKKYNLDEAILEGLDLKTYVFKYVTALELDILQRIMFIMVPGSIEASRIARWEKSIVSNLRYIDWITIECAYEYFRRHMKKEWKRVVAPHIAKCRKAKTKNRRRKELSEIFFHRYIIASKLYKEDELTTVKASSGKEQRDRLMLDEVEGGAYNRQLAGGLLLTQ